MKSIPYLLVYLFLYVSLLYSCKSTSYQSPENQIDLYVQEFLEEAEKRNTSLSTKDLKIEWGEMRWGQLGKCLPKKKRITLNERNWVVLDSLKRKKLVFHELAHCLLGRVGHKDDELPRGECASLLVTPEAECVCNIYEENWWKYYVDELFDEQTPLPIWYQDSIISDEIYVNLALANDTTFKFGFYFWDTHSFIKPMDTIAFELYVDSLSYKRGSIFFRIGDLSISTISNLRGQNVLQILHGASQAFTHLFYKGSFSNPHDSSDSFKLLVFYDHQFLRFYVNDQLCYKMGAKYWEQKADFFRSISVRVIQTNYTNEVDLSSMGQLRVYVRERD